MARTEALGMCLMLLLLVNFGIEAELIEERGFSLKQKYWLKFIEIHERASLSVTRDGYENYEDESIDRTAMGSAERKRFKISSKKVDIKKYRKKGGRISTRLHCKRSVYKITVPSEPIYYRRA